MQKSFILITALFLCFNASAQDSKEDPSSLLEQLVAEKIVVGVAAGYSVNNEIIWEGAKGNKNEEHNIALDVSTVMRIASISKPMTAVAVMQLVEQGLIDLDEPIQNYIPDYPKQEKTQITTRHLLSHTSGIDGYKNGKEAETTINYPTLNDAVDFFKNRALIFEPGARYSYTTYGYTVLGLLVEKASGLSFEDYMKKNIWDKAGMSETGVKKFGIAVANESNLYHREKRIKEGKENNLSNRIPGGGFYSTIGDLLKFGTAILDNTLVKASTMDIMRQHHSLEKEANAYGFGWFLYNPKPNEGALIGHTGEQTGSSAQIFIIPSTKTVVVALANTSGSLREISMLAGQLIRISQG